MLPQPPARNYNPVKTVLLREAKKYGLRTVEGLDMLIYQAQRAIEIWTDRTPDVNLMKIAALEALN
jgi:shikimate dehydrogenase